MKLTEAQRRNLEYIRDHGKCLPKNRAAYNCRVSGLSEFLWLFEDGAIATTNEKEPCEGCRLVKTVGEQLTEAGRAALKNSETAG